MFFIKNMLIALKLQIACAVRIKTEYAHLKTGQ